MAFLVFQYRQLVIRVGAWAISTGLGNASAQVHATWINFGDSKDVILFLADVT
jgi:hypothetical protein